MEAVNVVASSYLTGLEITAEADQAVERLVGVMGPAPAEEIAGRKTAGSRLAAAHGPLAEALALATGVVEVVLDACELAEPDVPYLLSANLRMPARLEVVAR